LVQLGDAAAAEKFLRGIHWRYPQNEAIATEWVRLAHSAGNWFEAACRCERMRAHQPLVPFGYYFGAACLRKAQRLEEAGELIKQAYSRFGQLPEMLIAHAELAHVRRNFDEATSLWERLRNEHGRAEGFIAGVASLRENRRYEDANALALICIERYPRNLGAWLEYASVAVARADWGEAAYRWERVRCVFPNITAGYVHGSTALVELGRLTEADELLTLAVGKAPKTRALLIRYAELAGRRNDWVAALDRWTKAQFFFPNDGVIGQRILQARVRLLECDPDAAATAEAAIPVGRLDLGIAAGLPQMTDDGIPMRDIMISFESLGAGKLGCEFGGMQRAFGAEPLGLLRWTSVAPAHLMAALEARFDGVGSPEFTEVISLDHPGRSEYWTKDKRFGMASHTFMDATAITPDKMLNQSCRRLSYLKNKLLDDLQNGTKIFVYKEMFGRPLSEREVDRFHSAMQAFGRNYLLYVRYTDSLHANATVEELRPGLMVGYMDDFLVAKDGSLLTGEAAKPVVSSWATLCVKAYKLWKGLPLSGPQANDAQKAA
jgi:tetratricopeptide (TPR) repeat protein